MKNLMDFIETNLDENIYQNIYFLKNGENAQKISHATVIENAKQLAVFFIKNFPPQSRIVLVYPQGIDFIAALLGCFYAGMIGVPAYPLQNIKHAYRLKKIINSCTPSLILGTNKTIADLTEIPEFDDLKKESSEVLLKEHENQAVDFIKTVIPPDYIAFLQYTSGSTGIPKGVMVSHFNLLHNLSTLKKSWEITKDRAIVNWLPFQHDLGLIGSVLTSFYNGNDLILVS